MTTIVLSILVILTTGWALFATYRGMKWCKLAYQIRDKYEQVIGETQELQGILYSLADQEEETQDYTMPGEKQPSIH